MNRALIFIAALTAATASSARPLDEVRASGTIRAAVYRDFSPFSASENGASLGLDVDLAAALAAELGVKLDLMTLTAGESVDDDLRNGVWKGHYLGGGVADVMLHVPYDRQLGLRNDNVVLFAPYYREQLAVLLDPRQTAGDNLVDAFEGKKVGVEGDSLADSYLTSAFGGMLRDGVVHFHDVAQAVAALRRGEIAGVVAPRSRIEGALGPGKGRYRIGLMPMPGLPISSWPIGMAVKVNAHDLANAIDAAVEGMIKDGRMAALFSKHGLTYVPPVSD